MYFVSILIDMYNEFNYFLKNMNFDFNIYRDYYMWILYKLCICKLLYDKWLFKYVYSFYKIKGWLFKFYLMLFYFCVYWNVNIVSIFFY